MSENANNPDNWNRDRDRKAVSITICTGFEPDALAGGFKVTYRCLRFSAEGRLESMGEEFTRIIHPDENYQTGGNPS